MGLTPIGKLIYVASPYSSPIRAVEEARNINVAVAMGWLMNEYPDLSFFSPICHTHPIATLCKLPGHWEYWKKYDEAMLSRCQEIWVLCLDGVEVSKGVNAEIGLAKELGVDLWYLYQQDDGSYVRAGWGFASPDGNMHHRMRISATKQEEILDEGIAALLAMSAHLRSCQTCIVKDAICCDEGKKLWEQADRAQVNLERMGIEFNVKFE